MGKKDQIQQATNQKIAVTQTKNKHREAALDEALKESFPASDPIAISFPPAVADVMPEQVQITGKPNSDTKNDTKRKTR